MNFGYLLEIEKKQTHTHTHTHTQKLELSEKYSKISEISISIIRRFWNIPRSKSSFEHFHIIQFLNMIYIQLIQIILQKMQY
jgi:hypothetical protein